jgi:shikimate kinase
MRRPIILIGLPGAGKTTVAPHAARLLDAPWCDLDARIVAQAGKPIATIFADHGEAHFRQLESSSLLELLDAPPQIIAAGAGWAAQEGNLAAVDGRALIIYMSLSAAAAAARLTGPSVRPLLDGAAPVQRIAELLAARDRWYRLADIEIDVSESSPEAVAAGIATAARQYGGW